MSFSTLNVDILTLSSLFVVVKHVIVSMEHISSITEGKHLFSSNVPTVLFMIDGGVLATCYLEVWWEVE